MQAPRRKYALESAAKLACSKKRAKRGQNGPFIFNCHVMARTREAVDVKDVVDVVDANGCA